MKIGLSLSFCVSDIINGLVDKYDVAYIIAGTRIRNNEEFKNVLDTYSGIYWNENPEEGKKIATDFYNSGRLLQPRILGGEPPTVFEGHWATVSHEV